MRHLNSLNSKVCYHNNEHVFASWHLFYIEDLIISPLHQDTGNTCMWYLIYIETVSQMCINYWAEHVLLNCLVCKLWNMFIWLAALFRHGCISLGLAMQSGSQSGPWLRWTRPDVMTWSVGLNDTHHPIWWQFCTEPNMCRTHMFCQAATSFRDGCISLKLGIQSGCLSATWIQWTNEI